MFARLASGAVVGVDASLIEVQEDLASGLPEKDERKRYRAGRSTSASLRERCVDLEGFLVVYS